MVPLNRKSLTLDAKWCDVNSNCLYYMVLKFMSFYWVYYPTEWLRIFKGNYLKSIQSDGIINNCYNHIKIFRWFHKWASESSAWLTLKCVFKMHYLTVFQIFKSNLLFSFELRFSTLIIFKFIDHLKKNQNSIFVHFSDESLYFP